MAGETTRRLSPLQIGLLVVLAAGVIYGASVAVGEWQRRREVYHGPALEPPPAVQQWRREQGYPWAEGLSREQRREAWKRFGEQWWGRTTRAQKMTVMRGYYPRIAARFAVRPEQQPAVEAVFDRTGNQILDIWNGWWREDFNRTLAVTRTFLLVGQVRADLTPVLDEEQLKQFDDWVLRAEEWREQGERRRAESEGRAATDEDGQPPGE